MSKFEPILNLSTEDLKVRRHQLQAELNKTITELVETGLRQSINELFALAGITTATRISWEFYPESDDEGGTDWHVSDLDVSFDGEEIDLEEATIKRESWRKDGTFYDCGVQDELWDIMSEFRDDLYDQDIYEIGL